VIRLLIIGREAEQLVQGLGFWEGQSIEIDTETLPAAGLRSFVEHSPDAIALAEGEKTGRIKPVVEALREKPLGEIVPIVVVGAAPPDRSELGISAVVEASAGAKALVDQLEGLLGVDLEPEERLKQTESRELEVVDESEETETSAGPSSKSTEIPVARPGFGDEPDRPASGGSEPSRGSGPDWQQGAEHDDYVIEPIGGEEESAGSQPPTRTTAEPDGSAGRGGRDRPSPEEIRRKLKEVRHEDYFAILDLARGADGDDVRQAYRRLKERFQPSSFDLEMADQFEAELDEINDAFDDARAVLGDDGLRESYLAKTTRK
jgi:hypothetical protein